MAAKGGGRRQTKEPIEHDLVSPFVISVFTTPNVNRELGKLAANICRYLSGHASVIVEVNVTSAAIRTKARRRDHLRSSSEPGLRPQPTLKPLPSNRGGLQILYRFPGRPNLRGVLVSWVFGVSVHC